MANIIVVLHIFREDAGNRLYTTVRKTYENTSLVPMVGMELEDRAWHDGREIRNVTINPTEDYYYIDIGSESGQNEEHCKEIAEMYRSHGWENLRS